jgi:hypothetical protein
MGGVYLFILLSLISLRRRDEKGIRLTPKDIISAFVFTLLSVPLGVIPAYLFLIFFKRGFRWLWLSWICHTFLIGGFLILLILPHNHFPGTAPAN